MLALKRAIGKFSWHIIEIYHIPNCVQVCSCENFGIEESSGVRSFSSKLCLEVDFKLLLKYYVSVSHKTKSYHGYK